ncbi:hypothetical protein NQ318_017281, partial [Aromia moschata]
LSEELALQNSKEVESETSDIIESENDVVTFKLKYLGSTVVEKITGESISTEAVKNILKTAKAKGRKKLQRVNVAISLKGIAVTDMQGNDIFKISIYRISNCSTDPTHRQIFSFIATDADETMECHAFICSKRKMTETVTLAVAHAFSTAYEAWRVLPTTKEFQKTAINVQDGDEQHKAEEEKDGSAGSGGAIEDVVEEKLIDFDDEAGNDEESFSFERPPCEQTVNTHWVSIRQNWYILNTNMDHVCFDDEFTNSKPTARPHYQVDLIFA